MDNQVKKLIRNKKEVTQKVELLFGTMNRDEIAKILGIKRNTLYKKCKKHNWKLKEIEIILKLVG